MVLGVLLFIAPWVFGYYSAFAGRGMDVLGGRCAHGPLGLWAVPESNRIHRAALSH